MKVRFLKTARMSFAAMIAGYYLLVLADFAPNSIAIHDVLLS